MLLKLKRKKHVGFNSIKVRLRPEIGNLLYAVPKFQFHKGTIKTK